jgi:tetratricopeptide (TPR) repeat protein
VTNIAQTCSQCGWAFDIAAISANTCKKCSSAILVTSVAYLEKFEKPAIQKYITHYTKALTANPQDAEALLAIGICYMQLGLFDLADKFLQRLIDADPTIAAGYYYRSICLFRGKRPRCVSLTVAREAERLASTAIEFDPANGRNDWLLAAIRHDYYVFNGLTVPQPGPDALLESAGQKHVDQLEIEQAFRLLKMQDNPLLGRSCS